MWSKDLRVRESAWYGVTDFCHNHSFFALQEIQDLVAGDIDGVVVAWPAHRCTI